MKTSNWTRILVALATTAFLAGLAGTAMAATKAKAKAKKGPVVSTVTGDLAKMTNKKGKLVGAQVKDSEGKLFNIILDRQGAKLAKALAGKKVELTGTLSMKGKGKAKKTWLRVKTFKEVAAAPAEPEEPAGGEGEEGGEGE